MLGTQKRAGVCVPLFSIYSRTSIGIGEITDLRLIIDWAEKTGISIVQLLPMNDVGFDFAPYSSESTFALEPMYLDIRKLKNVNINEYSNDVNELRLKYNTKQERVDYRIKKDKLALLKNIFKNSNIENADFEFFIAQNTYWLRNFALYKVIRETNNNDGWEKWDEKLKYRDETALRDFENEHKEEIEFQFWLQWQLYEQFKTIKQYSAGKDIKLMGDLPFLVSRESADVWAFQKYFKLELSSGAPPDMYFALGQKWGMPPYNWNNIASDNFDYIKQRLKYADNFYDMYRIDHFVGLFRLWTVATDTPPEQGAINGKFDPDNEALWEEHGKAVINAMIACTRMLPCGEDLGTVPACSYKVLNEYGIPGMDFQRYLKEDGMFKNMEQYRINSAAVISTHDSSFFINWWNYEAGTIDEKLFEMLCAKFLITGEAYEHFKNSLFDLNNSFNNRLLWKNEIYDENILWNKLPVYDHDKWQFMNMYKDAYKEKNKFMKLIYGDYYEPVNGSPNLIEKVLERTNQASSVFSIQLIFEYLYMNKKLFNKMNKWDYRINTPGTVNEKNWSVRIPVSLETLNRLKINEKIKKMIEDSGRNLNQDLEDLNRVL
jgi:4-alpha-glucanotransferase